jgi:cytochrome c oxidase subunit II
MPRSRAVVVLLGLFAAVVLASPLVFGIAGVPGASPPDSATDSGDTINRLYWVVYALAAGVFILVELTLIIFIFRFRQRRPGAHPEAEGPQIHGNTRIEVIWTAIPALLLLALLIFTFTQVPDVEAKPGEGEEVVTVHVAAHQFYWQYEYENGALSFDELVLPVDTKVTLRIDSEDVIHSWWVPELTGKRDAVPGQTNVLHFTPHTTGTFDGGVCGEFCGYEHARMTFSVRIVSSEEYDAYLEENAPAESEESLVALGEAEWSTACAKCHGLEGQGGGVGPPIARNGTLTNPEGLRTLLSEGQDREANDNYMPPVGAGWSDRQIEALVAYIRSNPDLAPEEAAGGR